ncbi:hypothetical protein TYRP_001496 [Tyrophagus putrescentiae]|nr:hypothetical protein TYRP_001496 [Tyrophagus putrescentiae]
MSITTVNANFLFMVVMVVTTIAVIIPITFASTSHPLDNDKGMVNMMEMLKDNESSSLIELRSLEESKDCHDKVLPQFKRCMIKYQHLLTELKFCEYYFNMQYCRAEEACEKCDYYDAIDVEKIARAVIKKKNAENAKCADYSPPKSLDVPFCTPMAASSQGGGHRHCGGHRRRPAAKARSRGESGVGVPNASSSNAYPQQQQGPAGAAVPSAGGAAYPAQQPPPPAYQQQQQPMAYQQQQPQPMAYQQQQQPMAYQQQQQPMAYGRP